MTKTTHDDPLIDNHDESLMRYYYLKFAHTHGVDRRTAEVQFRTDWFKIRRLDNNRVLVHREILKMVKAI